uniref:EF-hand domain-containing protein n=1 Tax=Cryptomonas curvata TaxID=233186 RepID=A0A7S0QFS0_9CRYP
MLHDESGRHCNALKVKTFINFFVRNSNELGLPNPDTLVLRSLIKAKDVSGDGTIDRQEFVEMMHQMVTIHNLFTGHELLEDMHYEQLARLYEYHKSGEMYLENVLKHKEGDDEVDSVFKKTMLALKAKFISDNSEAKVHAAQEMSKRISNVLNLFPEPEGVDKSGEVDNSMSGEVNAGFDSEKQFQNNPQVEFLGNKIMLHLKKKISQPRFEMLKQAMVSDLRKRILVLANEKAMDGTIAIPTVLWKSNADISASGRSKSDEGELKAVTRIGFLIKNYKVQHWYFELLEMTRKLIMTSIITFIYTGTPAQIAAALVTTLAFTLYTQRTKPFADDKIGDMQVFSLATQGFTLLYGLMLTIDNLTTLLGLEQSFTQTAVKNAIAGFVVFLNATIVIFPVLQRGVGYFQGYLDRKRHNKSIFLPGTAVKTNNGIVRDALQWNNSIVDNILKKGFLDSDPQICNHSRANIKATLPEGTVISGRAPIHKDESETSINTENVATERETGLTNQSCRLPGVLWMEEPEIQMALDSRKQGSYDPDLEDVTFSAASHKKL